MSRTQESRRGVSNPMSPIREIGHSTSSCSATRSGLSHQSHHLARARTPAGVADLSPFPAMPSIQLED